MVITVKQDSQAFSLKQIRGIKKLITDAEKDISTGKTRPIREFLKEFKSRKVIKGNSRCAIGIVYFPLHHLITHSHSFYLVALQPKRNYRSNIHKKYRNLK